MMDITKQIADARTADERLAIIAKTIMDKMLRIDLSSVADGNPRAMSPDYADFAQAFQLQLRKEFIEVRLNEHTYLETKLRRSILQQQLDEVEIEISLNPI